MTQQLIHGCHVAPILRTNGEYCFADGPTFIGWVHQSSVTEPTVQEAARFESWCQQMEQQEAAKQSKRRRRAA